LADDTPGVRAIVLSNAPLAISAGARRRYEVRNLGELGLTVRVRSAGRFLDFAGRQWTLSAEMRRERLLRSHCSPALIARHNASLHTRSSNAPTDQDFFVVQDSRTLLMVVSCLDKTTGVDKAKLVAPANKPALTISDAARDARGISGFYFRPPMLPVVSYPGTFDPDLSPEVVVCEWTGIACGAEVARFGMSTGTGGETVKLEDGQYHANWTPRQRILIPARRTGLSFPSTICCSFRRRRRRNDWWRRQECRH